MPPLAHIGHGPWELLFVVPVLLLAAVVIAMELRNRREQRDRPEEGEEERGG